MEIGNVLLVEDDQLDQETVRRAFKELNIGNPLHIVENGEEALSFLKDKSKPTPCLIMLDLNLPKMNGEDFLIERNKIDELKKIPVVVLTTSKDDTDLSECYKLGASGYLLKPVDYKEFVKVVKVVEAYWVLNLKPAVSKEKIG